MLLLNHDVAASNEYVRATRQFYEEQPEQQAREGKGQQVDVQSRGNGMQGAVVAFP